MEFEIRNDGNQPDRFAVTLDVPDGMEASITQVVDGLTTEIQPGASTNVTVTYFRGASEVKHSGSLQLAKQIPSECYWKRSLSGRSQNWLRIFPVSPIIINDADEDYEVTVQVETNILPHNP